MTSVSATTVALRGEEFDQRHLAENLVLAQGFEQPVPGQDTDAAPLNDVKLLAWISLAEDRLARFVIASRDVGPEEQTEAIGVVRHVVIHAHRIAARPFLNP